jgi:hypothetical protein
MHRIRVLLVIALSGSCVIALAAGAHANVRRASAATCDKITLTEADMGGLGGKRFDAEQFEDTARAFAAGAKADVPKKVKKAMKTMARYYDKLGEADSANEAIASITAQDTTKYAKASVTWGMFIATECSGA